MRTILFKWGIISTQILYLDEICTKLENDLKSLRDLVEMKQNQYESIEEMIIITEKSLNDTLTEKTVTIKS